MEDADRQSAIGVAKLSSGAAARLFECTASLAALVFAAVSLVVYIPTVVLQHVLADVTVALPRSVAASLVLDPEHDIDMATGLAIMLAVLLEFGAGCQLVASWRGAFLLQCAVQATFSLNPDHYSLHLHTEGHKYWGQGTWTFMLGGRTKTTAASRTPQCPALPIMDYLWFLTGYPPAWATVEHAKVHHVLHTMHPLDPDYIFDRPRNSPWSFLRFNLRALFLNMLNFGVLRLYLWQECADAAGVRRAPVVRRELERQLAVAAVAVTAVACANPHVLWFVAFNMLATNIDLNINTWVQHAFLNYNDGTCNPWCATTLAHDRLTWSGCAEHLRHHLIPGLSQESFIEWHKTDKARALRAKYRFHVFKAESTAAYYRLFWAIATADYEWLATAWVSPRGLEPTHGASARDGAAVVASVEDREAHCQLMATFKRELEGLFAPDYNIHAAS